MIFEILERTIFANKLIDDNRSIENGDSFFTFDMNVPTICMLPSTSTSTSSMLGVLFEALSSVVLGLVGDEEEEDITIATTDTSSPTLLVAAFTCDILSPNFVFYYQLIIIIIIQTIFNAIIGSFIYKIIIQPQQPQQQQPKIEELSNKNDGDDAGGNDDDDDGTSTSTSTSCISASSKSTASVTALLFGFGVAIPCVLFEPIYAIQVFQIKNLGLIMVFLATTIVIPLRIIEAVYGYTPFHNHNNTHTHNTSSNNILAKPATANSSCNISYWDYIIYFSCAFGIEFNNKNRNSSSNNSNKVTGTDGDSSSSVQQQSKSKSKQLKPISKGYFKARLVLISRDFMIASILISILKEYNYELFTTPNTTSIWDDQDYSIQGVWFSWQHILNNLLVVLLLSTSLSQSSLGISFLYNICYGYETYEMVLNPMFKSQSVSDFWGKRWNVLVLSGLKNGIYKPTRQITSSKIIATITTFLVSGIIHEYVNYVMFYEVSSSYRFKWKQILFFGYNGLLIVLEYCIFSRYNIFIWLSHLLPKISITVLILYSALPLAHLFTGDWIRYGYFDSICLAEPIIVCSRKDVLLE